MTNPSCHKLTELALDKAKSATSIILSRYLSMPARVHIDRSSPGAVMMSAIRDQANPSDVKTLMRHSKSIRKATEAEMAAADLLIEEAEAFAADWRRMAAYLDGSLLEQPVNTKLGEAIETAAVTVRKAVAAGVMPPSEAVTLAAELRRDADHAERAIEEARISYERVKSAALCSLAANAAEIFHRRSEDAGYSSIEKKSLRRLAGVYGSVSRQRKIAHAKKFYDAKQQHRTIGHLEFKAIGLKVDV